MFTAYTQLAFNFKPALLPYIPYRQHTMGVRGVSFLSQVYVVSNEARCSHITLSLGGWGFWNIPLKLKRKETLANKVVDLGWSRATPMVSWNTPGTSLNLVGKQNKKEGEKGFTWQSNSATIFSWCTSESSCRKINCELFFSLFTEMDCKWLNAFFTKWQWTDNMLLSLLSAYLEDFDLFS